MSETILEVKKLSRYFKTRSGMLHAVDGVSFSLMKGETLGVVGESGCGKSTLGRTILRLIEPTSGSVIYNGTDISKLSKEEMRRMRKEMQIIFQDPYSSLDPRKTVSQIIAEPLITHKICSGKQEIEKTVNEIMQRVGLAERLVNTYPHELDGGRRQRVGVARALATQPKFIVCDEPVSALDVSIQAQIINLLRRLQREMGLSYIFITHDMSVVNHLADRIAVMYLGRLVELAPVEELFANPLHPYTQALLSAVPIPEVQKVKRERIRLTGEISSPINPPDECRFRKRCRRACETCTGKEPLLQEVLPGHFVACHLVLAGGMPVIKDSPDPGRV